MAFLSRLFKRGSGDPLTERDAAHRQGMRDARQHALGEFTDQEFQPAFISELRARARERIAVLDQGLSAQRTALLREAGEARETILRELAGADLRPAASNGHLATAAEDSFISIAEARWRRAEKRRESVVRAASDTMHGARTRIEQLVREWESALIDRDHAVEAIQARADALIAAYRGGVMRAHPRREDVPPLWKGEVAATTQPPSATAGREDLGHMLRDVEDRIELWHQEVRPAALPAVHPEHLALEPSQETDRTEQEANETSLEADGAAQKAEHEADGAARKGDGTGGGEEGR